MKLPSVVFLDCVRICEINWKRERQNGRQMQAENNVWKFTVEVLQSRRTIFRVDLEKSCWGNKGDCTEKTGM